jgi:hypothetical protein
LSNLEYTYSAEYYRATKKHKLDLCLLSWKDSQHRDK